MKNRNKIFRTRAIMLTVAFLLVLLLANMLITKIVDKYPLKMDLTSDGKFTLSEESKKILKDLDKPVTIYLIESAKYPIKRDVVEIIDRYKKYADGKIEVISKDIVTDIAFGLELEGVHSIKDISYGNIIFTCGEHHRIEHEDDLMNDADMLYSTENTITNHIVYLTSDANSNVYMTVGHDEDDLGTLTTALNSHDYTFNSVNLIKNNIPDSAGLLLVVGPKKDFSVSEIEKLNSFMLNGGSIQIYLNPAAKKLTNLYGFAEEWGIEITDNYIEERDVDRIDIESSDLMHPYITPYSFTEGVFDENSTLVINEVHSLGYFESNPKGAQNVIAMLYTSEDAISRANANSPNAKTGEHYAAVMSTKYDDNGGDCNLMVVGTTSIFQQEYFDNKNSRYCNRDFFLKSVDWMCNFRDSIKISSKSVHYDNLGLSYADGIKYTILIFSVSIIILAIGIVVWARRRYL